MCFEIVDSTNNVTNLSHFVRFSRDLRTGQNWPKSFFRISKTFSDFPHTSSLTSWPFNIFTVICISNLIFCKGEDGNFKQILWLPRCWKQKTDSCVVTKLWPGFQASIRLQSPHGQPPRHSTFLCFFFLAWKFCYWAYCTLDFFLKMKCYHQHGTKKTSESHEH